MRTVFFIVFIASFIVAFVAGADTTGTKFTSFADFRLGTVTLADVQEKLGQAMLVETGDAGEYTASVCYEVPNGVVSFFAGELGGPKHNLGGFGYAKQTDRKPCSKWPVALPYPDLNIGGVYQGLSVAEFIQIVGVPAHVAGDQAYAHFVTKRTMSADEFKSLPEEAQQIVKTGKLQNYFDVFVSVVATFDKGHLQELRVWKSETY